MRFGMLLAAVAALFCQPAEAAVTITVNSLEKNSWIASSIKVTGANATSLTFSGFALGFSTTYWWWWHPFENGWSIDGNESAYGLNCDPMETFGFCSERNETPAGPFVGGAVARLDMRTSAKIDELDILVFVAAATFEPNNCLTIPEAQRVEFEPCSIAGWERPWANIRFEGPHANNLSYTVTTLGTGLVPEPATWALFIIGFGVIGGAVRRARASAGAASY